MDYRNAKHLFGIIKCPSPLILRLLRGCTSQTRLGSTLKVKASTIQGWETGVNTPTPDNLQAILKHFTRWTRDLGWPGLDLLCAAAESEERELATKEPQQT